MPPSEPTAYYVLLEPTELDVISALGTDEPKLPPGVVWLLPVYRTLVELHREHGIDAKYAQLVIGGGDGE